MHSIRVSIKYFKIWGTQHRLEYYPSSSHKESIHLGSLTGRVQIITKGGTEVHRFLGFLGPEVPRSTPTPHLPDELNPLLDSLTPLVTCSKVGTFGMRPMDE